MELRYRHWMQPANEGRWPSAIICVDCVGEMVRPDGAAGRMIERFVSWHAVRLTSHHGEYRADGERCGQSEDAMLRDLALLALVEPNLLVVSSQCNRVWSLLKLWEGIEDGRVQLSDTDHRDSDASRRRETEYRRRQADPLRTLSGSERHRFNQGTGGFLVIEDPPNILRCRLHGTGYSITWIDLRNHGIEAPATVEHGQDMARWLGATVSRMATLCRQCGLTALKATAGSQAMNAWRYSHLTEGVYVHTDGRATEAEGAAYCGGRCEARRIGVAEAPVYHLDFRSQYGRICADVALPAGLLDYVDCTGSPTCISADVAVRSIASVTVETDEPAYPLRRERDVIYPVGRFRTTLCGPELQDAILHNRIKVVHSVASYRTDYTLRSYALALWLMRMQEGELGNAATEQWAKRLIVSLPGRLGQRNHRWIDSPEIIPQSQWGEWYGHDDDGEPIRYRAIGGHVQRDSCDGYSADAVPAIAAWITSAGRMRLLAAIRCAGWEEVLYYDTDSLFTTRLGYERLLASEFMAETGLGALTLRGQPTYLDIRGIKYYVEDKRVVCAGLSRGSLVDSGDGHTYSRYLTATEQARRGTRPESMLVEGSYARAEAYTAGTVNVDGSVSPLRVWEE